MQTTALLVSLSGLVAVGAAGASPRGWEFAAATQVPPPKVVTAALHYAYPRAEILYLGREWSAIRPRR